MRFLAKIPCLVVLLASGQVLASEWEYEKEIDDFTDTTKCYAYTTNQTDGALIVRHNQKELQILVIFDEYLSNDYVEYRYRIDKGKPVNDSAVVSAKGTAIFIDRHRVPEISKAWITPSLFAKQLTTVSLNFI